MTKCGYEEATVQRARRLWSQWIEAKPPRIAKPEVYAAVIEYTTSTLYAIHTTQREVAERYNVSRSSVSRAYNVIVPLLGLSLGDPFEPSATRRHLDLLVSSLLDASIDLPRGDEIPSQALFHILKNTAQAPSLRDDSALYINLQDQRDLLSLSLLDTTWIGLRYPLSPEASPLPHPCDLALWIRCDTETILGYALLPQSAPDSVFMSHLLDTMRSPLTDLAHRPQTLLLCNPRIVPRIHTALEGLEIQCVPSTITPLLERFIQHTQNLLSTSATTHAKQPPLFPSETPEDIAATRALFQAAHDALSRTLWQHVPRTLWIAVDLHAYGLERPCITLPNTHSLHIFDSIQTASAAHNARSLARSLDTATHATSTLTEPTLSLSFEPTHNLHANDRKAILRHSLPLHTPSTCPTPLNHTASSPSRDDVRVLTIAFELLNALVDQGALPTTLPKNPLSVTVASLTAHTTSLSAFILAADQNS